MADHHEHSHSDCSEYEHEDEKWIEIERVYKEKSTEEESLVNWLAKAVDFYLTSLVASGDNVLAIEKYSVLSFGCGNGTKDRGILFAISSRLSEKGRILYHAVDPAASEIEKFRKAVPNENKSRESFKKVDFGFYVQTYEDYMESDFMKGANLILFIDSLCHFSSTPEDALVHCYDNVLAENGVILVTLWNNHDFWFKIREIYGKSRNGERTAKEGNDYLTVQEVHEIVKKKGWKSELFSPEYILDVTECFNSDSQDGKYLLECLACFSNVKEKVDADAKKLFKFLQDFALINGEKYLLTGYHGVLMIYKQ